MSGAADQKERLVSFSAVLVTLGVSMAVIGGIVEVVAIIGIVSYRVRRALPIDSPIALQSLGCIGFCVGLACAALGKWLAR
jgi:hypothetical protein